MNRIKIFIFILASYLHRSESELNEDFPGNATATVDDEILYNQEVLIGRLYAALGQLRSENTALRDKIGLLESNSASVGGAISASNAALKAEVFRLVRKTQEKRDNQLHHNDPSHNEEKHTFSGGEGEEEEEEERKKYNNNNNGIGQWTRPQQVNVVCKDAAAISVVPLAEEDRGNDECLILQFKAPDLDSRFVMYCDSASGNS
jgi:hypothetical protein